MARTLKLLAGMASKLVLVLEDDSLFNAGRGAVFNAAGEHELDAAIMDGDEQMVTELSLPGYA